MAKDIVDVEHLKAHEVDKERLRLARSVQEERALNSRFDSYQMPENYDEDQLKRLAVVKAKMSQVDTVHADKPLTDLQLWERQQTEAGMVVPKHRVEKESSDRNLKIVGETGEEIDFVLDPSSSLIKTKKDEDGEFIVIFRRSALIYTERTYAKGLNTCVTSQMFIYHRRRTCNVSVHILDYHLIFQNGGINPSSNERLKGERN